MIGLNRSSSFTFSKNSARRCKFASAAAAGVLSSVRWSVTVSSARVKCGVNYSPDLNELRRQAQAPPLILAPAVDIAEAPSESQLQIKLQDPLVLRVHQSVF